MTYQLTKEERKQLSLTIYNEGFALVKEIRELNLSDEDQEIYFLDVPTKIETDSILVHGLDVLELNYEYDLVSKKKLLEKYIDQEIMIRDTKVDSQTTYRLLSVADGIVVENTENKEIVIDPKGQMVLPKLLAGLITKPSLVWKISKPASNQVDVSYLTKGFEWVANYVVHLGSDRFDLNGWVDINNTSGATYENASIKLLAGEVARAVKQSTTFDWMEHEMVRSVGSIQQAEPAFTEKSFQDFHLYTLNTPTTIKDNQSKQINFLQKQQIPYERYYQNHNDSVQIIIKFENKEDKCLGVPLPKGKIKFYGEDQADQQLEFVGEVELEHVPVNEELTLNLGNAFDIKCKKTITNSRKKSSYIIDDITYEIKNNKKEAIRFKLIHSNHYREWNVTSSSHKFESEDNQTVYFWIDIPPESTELVKITSKSRYSY